MNVWRFFLWTGGQSTAAGGTIIQNGIKTENAHQVLRALGSSLLRSQNTGPEAFYPSIKNWKSLLWGIWPSLQESSKQQPVVKVKQWRQQAPPTVRAFLVHPIKYKDQQYLRTCKTNTNRKKLNKQCSRRKPQYLQRWEDTAPTKQEQEAIKEKDLGNKDTF